MCHNVHYTYYKHFDEINKQALLYNKNSSGTKIAPIFIVLYQWNILFIIFPFNCFPLPSPVFEIQIVLYDLYTYILHRNKSLLDDSPECIVLDRILCCYTNKRPIYIRITFILEIILSLLRWTFFVKPEVVAIAEF